MTVLRYPGTARVSGCRGDLDDDQKRDVRTEFGEAVNTSASQLRTWLDSDESRAVGDTGGSAKESPGHEMGRHIVELRDKHVADLDDEDYGRSTCGSPPCSAAR